MASSKQLQSPEMYTIGWIAALDKELTAAQSVLDEEHRRPANFRKQPKDTNNYAWGRIGDHNIVIASLAAGKIGTVSAATTAMSMISSLPHLRFGLMVGIGAGVPRLADNIDIRLGDVVVSQPTGASPGVVQYDLGKLGKDGQFKRIGALAPPPEVLLKGLATLKAIQRRKGTRLTAILDEAIQLNPRLAEPELDDAAFVHQGAQNDRLFEAFSEHIQHPSQQVGPQKAITPQNPSDQIMSQARACAHCDYRKEVKRPERRSTEPKIHYGVIASGNWVVKDGIFRDQIALNLGDGCICFEMEAAGLMDNFPCLVIRGICDYADTHKNDRWQNYAAITAAAYAKELLQVLEGENVEGALRMDEIMGNVHELALQTHSTMKEMQQDQRSQKIVKWLAPPDVSTNDNKALKQRYGNTGQWFLRSEEYSQWKTTPKSSLWLRGIPGCGKTVLSSIIIDDLRHAGSYSDNLIYFYFDFSDTSKQSLENAIRSLVYQLYQKSPSVYQGYLHSLYSSCENGSRMPNVNLLNETLEKMAQHIGELWIVLDALDECQTRKGAKNEGLLSWIKDFSNGSRADIHFLLTSRPERDIESALSKFVDH
ncbi:hypothetical protein PspLS_11579 [Pyricularia sp. CBS 133598]|nr:hypothetical protein PspLS_11579 [Pyricularia sp. CBS 133598]